MNFGESQQLLQNSIAGCEIILKQNESLNKDIENLEKNQKENVNQLKTTQEKLENYQSLLLDIYKIPANQRSKKEDDNITKIEGKIEKFEQKIVNLKSEQETIRNSITKLKDQQESSQPILQLAKSFMLLQQMYEKKITETEEKEKKEKKDVKKKGKVFFFTIFKKWNI